MDWRKLGKRLLFPPFWVLVLLTAICGLGLTTVFLKDLVESPLAYGIFALSFYWVCVLTAFCAMILPGKYRAIRQEINKHPLGRRYMQDAAFRTHVKLQTSLAINLLYVGINCLSYFLYRSVWFVILAVYYGILAVMRFLLVSHAHTHGIGKNRPSELRRARLCASILLLVNIVLSGAVLMILYQDKGYEYHGVLIYVMAAYTFYITIHAIVDLAKYRKYRSPVMTVSKVVSLSAALVSMLNLETAMFSQFGGDMSPENRWLMVALTGAGVSLAVIAMSVNMIIRTAKEIKEINKDGKSE